MGYSRTNNRTPMDWQSTVGAMRRHGTRLALTCGAVACRTWTELDVDALIARHGEAWMVWDRRDPCPVCGAKSHYMGSPGPATPYRPLLSGAAADAARREFLLSFRFSRRDVLRIKILAEEATSTWAPAALNDLDVPFVVAVAPAGKPPPASARVLGEWSGRTLLYWTMNPLEKARWEKRPRAARSI